MKKVTLCTLLLLASFVDTGVASAATTPAPVVSATTTEYAILIGLHNWLDSWGF